MSITAYTKGGKRAYRAKVKRLGVQHTQAGFATKEAARAWMVAKRKELKEEAKAPAAPPQEDSMFSRSLALYLESCAPRMQPSTVQEKKTHLKEFAAFLGGDILLQDVTERIASKHIAAVQAEGGNKSANRHLRNLKAMWNWSLKKGLVVGNVWCQVEPYPEDTPPRYVPPSEDVAAALMAAQPWEKDFLNLMLRTGARAGELRKLTWEDVDLSRGVITLWTRKRKGGALQPRAINMSPQLRDLMKHLWERRDRHSAHVFTNPLTGTGYTRLQHTMRYMMERLCERAQVKAFGLHSLRHYVAVRLRDSGKASKFDIMAILGHQRSDTTDIYLRGMAPRLEDAVSALDEEPIEKADACTPEVYPLSSR